MKATTPQVRTISDRAHQWEILQISNSGSASGNPKWRQKWTYIQTLLIFVEIYAVSNISIRERSVNSNYVLQKAEHFRHRSEFYCQYAMANPFGEGERNIRYTRGCELGKGACQYGAHWGFGATSCQVCIGFLPAIHTQMDLLNLRAWGQADKSRCCI